MLCFAKTQFRSAEGLRGSRSAGEAHKKEDDVIIIDGSKPLDLTKFGGKMPKITSSQLEMTDIVTGDIHIVTSRGTTIIPGNKNKQDAKPEASAGTTAPVSTVPQTSSADAAPVEAPTEQSRNSGTTENSPPFQRREGVEAEDQFLAAAGLRVAERSATEERPDAASDKKPEPNNDKPKRDANSRLPGPPDKPRDLRVDPPKIPLRLQGRRIPPGCKLHPMIEYWGLH